MAEIFFIEQWHVDCTSVTLYCSFIHCPEAVKLKVPWHEKPFFPLICTYINWSSHSHQITEWGVLRHLCRLQAVEIQLPSRRNHGKWNQPHTRSWVEWCSILNPSGLLWCGPTLCCHNGFNSTGKNLHKSLGVCLCEFLTILKEALSPREARFFTHTKRTRLRT